MPTDVRFSHNGQTLTFRLQGGGMGLREYPHEVAPRRLAGTLVECATGGSWWIDDLDADVSLQAASRQVFVIPAEQKHRLRMVKGSAMRSRWWLIALEDDLGRDLFVHLSRSMVLPLRVSRSVASTLSKLETGEPRGIMDRLRFQQAGLEVASLILRHTPAPLRGPVKPMDDRIERVLRLMRDNLHRPLSRGELARTAHLSPTRFHYVFLNATGQAPVTYLMAQRMRRARQLLHSTSLSSKEIGQQCGFQSPTHFSRVFTKLTGHSPLSYRAQLPSQ